MSRKSPSSTIQTDGRNHGLCELVVGVPFLAHFNTGNSRRGRRTPASCGRVGHQSSPQQCGTTYHTCFVFCLHKPHLCRVRILLLMCRVDLVTSSQHHCRVPVTPKQYRQRASVRLVHHVKMSRARRSRTAAGRTRRGMKEPARGQCCSRESCL